MVNLPVLIYLFVNLYMVNSGILFLLPLLISSKDDYDVVNRLLSRNILYVLSSAVGVLLAVLKLFFPMTSILLFGDLIPFAVLLITSFIYLLGYIRISKSLNQKQIAKGEEILMKIQIPVGILSLVAGILHIFLAKWLFF